MEETFVTGSTLTASFLRTEETSSWLSIDYLSRVNESLELQSDRHASPDSSFVSFGPHRDPLYVVVPITVIYLLIFFTGTVGNVSTCIVIARNKSMHTATNYYLFSLAVSDLLLLISGLPVEVYLVWAKFSYVFGEGFCMFRGMAAECSTNASVLTITAFTVERYVAICHPFRSHTMSNLSRAVKLILVIWLVALIFAIPMALQFGLVKYNDNPEILVCTFKVTLYEHSFEIATFLFFVVPMILITVLYVMIGLKLRQSNLMKRDTGTSRSVRDSSTSANTVRTSVTKERNCRHHTGRSSRRVLKMLVAVVVAFFICWAPFHVQRLIAIYGTDEDRVTSTSKWMEFLYLLFTYVSGVLYYVSATINPILYNIMSNKFREASMETLARTCGRSSGFSGQQEQRSYSSLSRSQQRGAGIFGSRTVASAGAVQDSMDCSGNSVRDESLRRSPSVTGQQDVVASLETNVDPAQRSIFNGNERYAGFTRKASYNQSDTRTSGEATLNLLDSSSRLPANQGRAREKAYSFGDRVDKTRRWHESSNKYSNNSATGKNNRANSTTEFNSSGGHRKNQAHHHHRRQLGLGTIETDVPSRKKWWRLFKWLPGAKVFKFKNARTRYSSPSDPMVNDIESNREEYSMTSCYVRNGTQQRPV